MGMRPLFVALLFGALFVVSHLAHRWRRRRGPMRSWPAHGIGLDALYWIVTPTASAWLSRGLVAALMAGVGGLLWTQPDQAWTGHGVAAALPWWARPVAAIVCADFANYWLHRALHRYPLWPFHAIHHSSLDLDWHSALRIHPVERALMQLSALAFLLLLGFPLGSLAVAAPVAFLIGVLVHTDTSIDFGRLSFLVATPAFHRWHHSQDADAQRRNFAGILPLWDLLFGTFYLPKHHLPGNFGAGEPVPQSLVAQMTYPFVNLAGCLRGDCGTRWAPLRTRRGTPD